jgi:hypothetical protein
MDGHSAASPQPKNIIGTQMNTDKLSAAEPQPKNLYWTQINTDKHRFYIGNRIKEQRPSGVQVKIDRGE